MKSVLNAAARRNLDQVKNSMSPQALELAGQALQFRSEAPASLASTPQALAQPQELPSLGHAPDLATATANGRAGQPLAQYLAAHRVGNLLYLSGVIAVNPATKKVISSYEDLPAQARQELRQLGYDTGQLSVDIFEAPIVAQSWFVLSRIRETAQQHGAQMSDVFKLVQYFKDLRHYPAYNRVRHLFCPAGVVSTVVEVSGMLPSPDVLIEVEATVSLA